MKSPTSQAVCMMLIVAIYLGHQISRGIYQDLPWCILAIALCVGIVIASRKYGINVFKMLAKKLRSLLCTSIGSEKLKKKKHRLTGDDLY